MTLSDLAARIDAHLKRMEKDPAVNAPKVPGIRHRRLFNSPTATPATGGIRVLYCAVLKESAKIERATAERCLAWLDAGGVGRHFEMGERHERS